MMVGLMQDLRYSMHMRRPHLSSRCWTGSCLTQNHTLLRRASPPSSPPACWQLSGQNAQCAWRAGSPFCMSGAKPFVMHNAVRVQVVYSAGGVRHSLQFIVHNAACVQEVHSAGVRHGHL